MAADPQIVVARKKPVNVGPPATPSPGVWRRLAENQNPATFNQGSPGVLPGDQLRRRGKG